MGVNFRKSIDGAKDSRVKPVDIQAWPHLDDAGNPVLKEDGTPNCTYFVRDMSLAEREAYDAAIMVQKNGDMTVDYKVVRSELLVRTLCDADGVRLFEDRDIAILRERNGAACMAAFVAAQEINGLGEQPAKN